MLRLYDYPDSGNCYKVRLLLAQLGMPYERVAVDLAAGEHRTAEFLARNSDGRVPLLETPDGGLIAESNAILCHLAAGTRFMPDDPLARARALQWLFFEQNRLEINVATLRRWITIFRRPHEIAGQIAGLRERAQVALGVMERHLAGHAFFAAPRYSIADIGLYAYAHLAPDGDLDLDPYPALRAWFGRVRAEPGHVPITANG